MNLTEQRDKLLEIVIGIIDSNPVGVDEALIGNARILVNDLSSKNKSSIPTIEEMVYFFSENGFNRNLAEKAYNYYTRLEWKDSNGKKVKNWKLKIRGVWFSEKNSLYRIENKKTSDDYSDEELKNILEK